jgi:hypothetical protein
MYHDDRVLRVLLVLDSTGSFVEWIERWGAWLKA